MAKTWSDEHEFLSKLLDVLIGAKIVEEKAGAPSQHIESAIRMVSDRLDATAKSEPEVPRAQE